MKGECGGADHRMKKIMAQYRSSGRELRKSPKGLIAGILVAAMAISGAFGIRIVLDNMESLVPEPVSEVEIDVPESEPDSFEDPNAMQYGLTGFAVEKIRHGPLSIINNDFPTVDIEEGIVSVFEQKNDYLTVRDLDVRLMDEAMLALNQMSAAFYEATGHADLLIKNGYITSDEQKAVYEADLQMMGGSTKVPIPGGNEFESGYTFELSLFTNGFFQDFTDEGDYEWIMRHCAEYGFVQRYPENKSSITKVEDQPWVFRYVGTPHAWYMYKNDLCLEEYIALLEQHPQDGEHYMVFDQYGRNYEVYYVSIDPSEMTGDVQDVYIQTPMDYSFSVSGNNKHGFFVTVEME